MSIHKLPGVLAFQRAVVISDGVFENMDGSPLSVIRHGIRGTQNQSNAKQKVNNIQNTDSAKLAQDSSVLVARFSFRALPLKKSLSAVNGESAQDFRKILEAFLAQVEDSESLQDVASRIVANICNGRWLWRNRVCAEKIEIKIRVRDKVIECSALDFPLNGFRLPEDSTAAVNALADGFCDRGSPLITVEARIDFGVPGAEVYPSQNYIDGKPAGFARPLYCVANRRLETPDAEDRKTVVRVMGQAALRDQKIWNALRTIDTWYSPDGARPIPVEPLGASLEDQVFYREYKNGKGNSMFDYLRRLDEVKSGSDEERFAIACLIRGGVFSSDSDKADKENRNKMDEIKQPAEVGGD
jgi:CRISPR-associated protein Csy3